MCQFERVHAMSLSLWRLETSVVYITVVLALLRGHMQQTIKGTSFDLAVNIYIPWVGVRLCTSSDGWLGWVLNPG